MARALFTTNALIVFAFTLSSIVLLIGFSSTFVYVHYQNPDITGTSFQIVRGVLCLTDYIDQDPALTERMRELSLKYAKPLLEVKIERPGIRWPALLPSTENVTDRLRETRVPLVWWCFAISIVGFALIALASFARKRPK